MKRILSAVVLLTGTGVFADDTMKKAGEQIDKAAAATKKTAKQAATEIASGSKKVASDVSSAAKKVASDTSDSTKKAFSKKRDAAPPK